MESIKRFMIKQNYVFFKNRPRTLICYMALWAILSTPSISNGQIRPNVLSIGYFGELVTHPGLSVGLSFSISEWEKKRKADITQSLVFRPTASIFHHRRYQTGIILKPELALFRQKSGGSYRAIGSGGGYMRTIIPNSYEVSGTEVAKSTFSGHNYFIGSIFFEFGKSSRSGPWGYYIKPQLLYAIPNFPNGVGYLAFEIGLTHQLNSK